MGEFYEFLCAENRLQRSGAVLRVTGDRNLPVMEALLDLYVKEPEKLTGLVEVIPADGYPLHFEEVRQFRPPYMRALRDISRFLRLHGYEDAGRFLDHGLEP